MRTRGLASVAVALAFLAIACSSARRSVAVSASTNAATTTETGGVDVGNGVVVERIRIAVRSLELEGGSCQGGTPCSGGCKEEGEDGEKACVAAAGSGTSSSSSCTGECEGEGDEGEKTCGDDREVKAGPFLIDLSGDALSTRTHVLDWAVPAGTWCELELVLAPVVPADAASDPKLADLSGKTVVVDGTVNGQPFTLGLAFAVEQERGVKLVVASDGTTQEITVDFDVATWFKAPDGTGLDPTKPESEAQIARNVRASLRAVCDD